MSEDEPEVGDDPAPELAPTPEPETGPPPPKRTKGGLAKKQQTQKRSYQCVSESEKRRHEADGYASDMYDDGPDAAFWKAVREDVDATGRFAYYFPIGDLCVKIGEDRSLTPEVRNELHVLMAWKGRAQTGVEKLLQLVGKDRIVHVLAVFKETAEAKGYNVTMGSPQAVWPTVRNGAFLDRPKGRPRPSLKIRVPRAPVTLTPANGGVKLEDPGAPVEDGVLEVEVEAELVDLEHATGADDDDEGEGQEGVEVVQAELAEQPEAQVEEPAAEDDDADDAYEQQVMEGVAVKEASLHKADWWREKQRQATELGVTLQYTWTFREIIRYLMALPDLDAHTRAALTSMSTSFNPNQRNDTFDRMCTLVGNEQLLATAKAFIADAEAWNFVVRPVVPLISKRGTLILRSGAHMHIECEARRQYLESDAGRMVEGFRLDPLPDDTTPSGWTVSWVADQYATPGMYYRVYVPESHGAGYFYFCIPAGAKPKSILHIPVPLQRWLEGVERSLWRIAWTHEPKLKSVASMGVGVTWENVLAHENSLRASSTATRAREERERLQKFKEAKEAARHMQRGAFDATLRRCTRRRSCGSKCTCTRSPTRNKPPTT